jgi:hypothetical protein
LHAGEKILDNLRHGGADCSGTGDHSTSTSRKDATVAGHSFVFAADKMPMTDSPKTPLSSWYPMRFLTMLTAAAATAAPTPGMTPSMFDNQGERAMPPVITALLSKASFFL